MRTDDDGPGRVNAMATLARHRGLCVDVEEGTVSNAEQDTTVDPGSLQEELREIAALLGADPEAAVAVLEEAGKDEDFQHPSSDDAGDITDPTVYGPAHSAVAAMLGQPTGQDVSDQQPPGSAIVAAIGKLHEDSLALADQQIDALVEQYGEEGAGQIIGQLSLSHPHAVAGVPGTLSASPAAKALIGAIPLLCLAEAGKRAGIVGHGGELEQSLQRAGSWIHAIKDASGPVEDDEEEDEEEDDGMEDETDDDDPKGEAFEIAKGVGAVGLPNDRPAQGQPIGRGSGKLAGNAKQGFFCTNAAGQRIIGPGWVLVGPNEYAVIDVAGRVVPRYGEVENAKDAGGHGSNKRTVEQSGALLKGHVDSGEEHMRDSLSHAEATTLVDEMSQHSHDELKQVAQHAGVFMRGESKKKLLDRIHRKLTLWQRASDANQV